MQQNIISKFFQHIVSTSFNSNSKIIAIQIHFLKLKSSKIKEIYKSQKIKTLKIFLLVRHNE